jgi:hypothetical protein
VWLSGGSLVVSLEIRRRDTERSAEMAIQDLTDPELSRLFIDTGIDTPRRRNGA